MSKALYLARVELHYADELYDKLHKAMDGIKFDRQGTLLSSKKKVELPHATYFATFANTNLVEVAKLIRQQVKKDLKIPVRTSKHSKKDKTFSFMAAKLDGVARVCGLQPKKTALEELLDLLDA